MFVRALLDNDLVNTFTGSLSKSISFQEKLCPLKTFLMNNIEVWSPIFKPKPVKYRKV